jgi:LPPG:FO 2-phospho-L-lactate transferase
MSGPIVVLSGGVGGAQFVRGLIEVVPREDVVVIGNTGDDVEVWGLRVSPDLDTVLYTLADAIHSEQKWGRADETFHCLAEVTRYGLPDWFRLGDKDLAVHLFRTAGLRAGRTLSEVTKDISKAWQLRVRLVPMSDQPVRTHVLTDSGELPFQEYFVHRRAQDRVRGVRFEGAARSRPAPGILQCLADARAIIIAPSNPVLSVQPILSVPGISAALREARSKRVAVSPLIRSRAVKGPTASCLEGLGFEVSNRGIAAVYSGLIDGLIIDASDEGDAPGLRDAGLRVGVTPTLMKDLGCAARLAEAALRLVA